MLKSLNRKSLLIILIWHDGFMTGKVKVSFLDLCSQTKIIPNRREKISKVGSNLALNFRVRTLWTFTFYFIFWTTFICSNRSGICLDYTRQFLHRFNLCAYTIVIAKMKAHLQNPCTRSNTSSSNVIRWLTHQTGLRKVVFKLIDFHEVCFWSIIKMGKNCKRSKCFPALL